MKVVIRLALYGCTNRPFYHLVAIPHKRARNGQALEQLGTYDPMPNRDNERLMAINFERLNYWITSGAEPTKPVQILLGLAGYFPIHPTIYLRAKRLRFAQEVASEPSENIESGKNQEAQS